MEVLCNAQQTEGAVPMVQVIWAVRAVSAVKNDYLGQVDHVTDWWMGFSFLSRALV